LAGALRLAFEGRIRNLKIYDYGVRGGFCGSQQVREDMVYQDPNVEIGNTQSSHLTEASSVDNHLYVIIIIIIIIMLNRLQVIQNPLARAVTKTPRHNHITPILKNKHSAKRSRTDLFNVLSIAYTLLQNYQLTFANFSPFCQPTLQNPPPI